MQDIYYARRVRFSLRNPFYILSLVLLWRVALLVFTVQPIPANDAFGYDGGMLPKPYFMGGIWDGIPGFPQWRDVRFFCWRQVERSLKQTLYTKAMIIRQRFQRVV